MKAIVLVIATLSLLIGFTERSHALLGIDNGSQDLSMILSSKQVDEKIQSLAAREVYPVHLDVAKFERCNPDARPVTCTYSLQFTSLGGDGTTHLCKIEIDVQAGQQITNITDPACVLKNKAR